MKAIKITPLILSVLLFSPSILYAQGMANEMRSLHAVLDQLYNEMMPLCSRLIGVAQGIAGFGALFYIGSRVWRHINNAEPIDFYPLFRPFVLGFAIMIFPSVLGIINGVMKPTVTATAEMMQGSNNAIARLLKEKEKQVKNSKAWQMYVGEQQNGNRDKWYKYTHDNADPSGEGMLEGIGNDVRFAMAKASYNFRNSVKEWLSEVLRIVFEAAALCINTLRTFNLVVMAILGPLVFGLAVFDGLQSSLSAWLARYLNIFLWLPVANIFGSIIGKVQEKMLEKDIGEIINNGDTMFSSTDSAYIVFLLIGIVGYFTVPTVAGYIVNAGGAGAMVQKVTSLMAGTAGLAGSAAKATGTTAMHGAGNIINANGYYQQRDTGHYDGSAQTASNGASTAGGAYMQDKLSGSK